MQALVWVGLVVAAGVIAGAVWFENTVPDRAMARFARQEGWTSSSRPDAGLRAVAAVRLSTRRRLRGSATQTRDGVEVTIFGWMVKGNADHNKAPEGNTIVTTRRPGRSLPDLELAPLPIAGRDAQRLPPDRPVVSVVHGRSDPRVRAIAGDERTVELMREWPGLRIRSEGDELWVWRNQPLSTGEGRSLVPVALTLRQVVEDLG